MRFQLIGALVLMAVLIASCAPQKAPEAMQPQPQAPPAPQPPAQAPPEGAPAEAAPAEETMEKPQPMTGEYKVTKEDGVVRGVGCDYKSRTVTFELNNPSKTDWTFYKKVSPTPPNQIKTVFNGLTLLDITCDAETLKAGETVKCSKTDGDYMVKFRDPSTEFMDDFTIIAPGNRDELKFRCVERGEWTPETTEDYTTRVE